MDSSRSWLALAVLVGGAACYSCAPKSTAHAVEHEGGPALRVIVAHTRDADDLARFLAGLPGREGSPFLHLQESEQWREHAQECDRIWGSFERDRLPPLREFAEHELARLPASTNGAVFYPFGGPDALTVTTFFPTESTYVMIGLEPPGTLMRVKAFPEEKLGEKLAAMRGTLESLLVRSFFITRQMDKQLRGQVADGVLADILFQIVRSGHSILGFREIMIDASAHITDRAEPVAGQARNRGIAIEFEDGRDKATHQLLYFTVNLSDKPLGKNPQIFEWLSRGSPLVTFLKSTSYLTHQDGFSLVRDKILQHSTAILQDDSGIPYHFLTSKAWNVQLFGDYQQPYGSFRYLVQKDLQEAFREGKEVKPLPFRIGYGYGKAPSNLILATKPGPVAALLTPGYR